MKKLFILLGIALLPAALIAQSKKVKVYAYKQDVLPGVRKTTIDESGSTREVSAKMNVNSLLYLEIPLGKKVEPKHVWINGKLYDVNASSPTLPVVMYNTSFPGKKPDTLV